MENSEIKNTMDSASSRTSFTAADSFPFKLARNWNAIKKIVEKGKIPPLHLQLCPTNRCTRNCSFCSCENRDKNAELSINEIEIIISEFRKLGTESVTITGGGEPLMHPDIHRIIQLFVNVGIKVGLVTNGDLIDKDINWKNVTWCRISCSDETDLRIYKRWISKIIHTVNINPNVDWGFSYVLLNKTNIENLSAFASIATNLNFTHMRVVSDLLNYDNIPYSEELEEVIKRYPIILYQGRKNPLAGRKECKISLLKPIIDATGSIFPCCGIQYAEKNPSKDFNDEMCMGSIYDIEEIWSKGKFFDGSVCNHCYYDDYNYYLKMISSNNIKHEEFV